MENKLTISAIVLMVIGFTYFGISGLEPTHACYSKETKAHCFELSKGLGTRCYIAPAKSSWKVCSEGWEEMPFIPSKISIELISSSPGGERHHYNSNGCIDCE